jgi:hypothetical protein
VLPVASLKDVELAAFADVVGGEGRDRARAGFLFGCRLAVVGDVGDVVDELVHLGDLLTLGRMISLASSQTRRSSMSARSLVRIAIE